jgi:hypothetical protein
MFNLLYAGRGTTAFEREYKALKIFKNSPEMRALLINQKTILKQWP